MRRRVPLAARLAAPLAIVALAAALAGAGPSDEPQPAAAYSFGQTPWADAGAAAAAAPRSCPITNDGLRALMLAPVWGETGAGSGTPSPMTLSRWDTQSTLYSFGNTSTYRSAFWHPGVGMWQFDSAGLSSSWGMATAAEHISTSVNAGSAFAANTMATRYCNAKDGGATDAAARAAAWAPWNACQGNPGAGVCTTIFNEIRNNGVLGDAAVGRYGGMVQRKCNRGTGPDHLCYYVDPAAVQGANAWTSPGFGQSPVTAPFYVFNESGREVRVWLREDTGYGIDIEARRPLGQNARSSLTWYATSSLCVRVSSEPQTFCDVSPTHPFFDEIEWVAAEGIAGGYANGDFRPAAPVSRQAMAAFTYRLADGGSVSGPAHFTDVSSGHEFFTEIEWLVDQGVVDGYPDGTFRPLQSVSREATAAFMYRLAQATAGPPPSATFPDVPTTHTFFTEIEWLVAEEITQGYGDGTYRPGATVTRQAMAAFLMRLDPLVV